MPPTGPPALVSASSPAGAAAGCGRGSGGARLRTRQQPGMQQQQQQVAARCCMLLQRRLLCTLPAAAACSTFGCGSVGQQQQQQQQQQLGPAPLPAAGFLGRRQFRGGALSTSTRPQHHHHHAMRTASTTSTARAAAAAADAQAGSSGGQHPLLGWVLGNGGSVHEGVAVANLAGSDGGSGWGLLATQAIEQPGTRLVELPRSCHLTHDESSDPRVLSLIQQVPDELWGAKLALQLLVQRIRGPQSPWATYIAALPVGVSGVPMFYPRDALEAIEYPPVVEQVKKRGRWLHRFSHDVLSGLPGAAVDDPFDGVTIDINSLGWALAVVTSRAFRVAGPAAPAALLPLIDMANHSFTPNCEVLPVTGGVALVAKCEIAAGEPLLLSYGELSNDFLLMDYGFVVPSNPYDRVALRFDTELLNAAAFEGKARDSAGKLLQLSTGAPWRQALLQRLGLFGGSKKPNLQVLLGGPALVEPRLLAAVRGLVATYQSEVENLTLEVLGNWERPLNKQNETATIRTLLGLALVALRNFSSGLESDLGLLGSSSSNGDQPPQQQQQQQHPGEPLSPEMELAVAFRAQKKQLLLDVVSGLAEKLKQVPKISGLKESPVVVAKKGQKPRPATNKGFGS